MMTMKSTKWCEEASFLLISTTTPVFLKPVSYRRRETTALAGWLAGYDADPLCCWLLWLFAVVIRHGRHYTATEILSVIYE